MADNVIVAIKSVIDNINSTGSYGWSVQTQSSPNRKEWDTLPVVKIVPSGKTDLKWIAFCNRRIENRYQVILIDNQTLDNSFSDTANNFEVELIRNFDRTPPALTSVGAYMTRVAPSYSYDRNLFAIGYRSTCVEIKVSTIIDSVN